MVDARQSQHFDMIFRTAQRAGWRTDDTEVVHVQTGTINGPDGRPFKTRAGGTVRLADLLDEALRQAGRVVAEKGLSCRMCGSFCGGLAAGEGGSVSGEGEHDEGDDRFGGVEAEAAADDQAGLGVRDSMSPLVMPVVRAARMAS